jgi:beta-glucosidase/6-phospho-beta-glucosidase/beta-galactosidase
MEKCRHYQNWSLDFDLVEDLRINYLRYGPPIHTTWVGPNQFDWRFADLTFTDLARRNIVPIADLCHFGVPDWIGNFQNPDFPKLFAHYCQQFAKRFPWVQLYTPINEMFICALFSASYGWWNEQETSDRAFVTALKHIVKANILAMDAILKIRPDAIFVQSESSEYFHAEDPSAIKPAEVLNSKRFLSLDLNYGVRLDSQMYEFLLDNGMTREEYHFFFGWGFKHNSIMGNDYYASNEHRVMHNGMTKPSGEVFGYDEITSQYYNRYLLPVMHTETNLAEGPTGEEAVNWLWKQWANVLRIRNKGIPVMGFTWYSLTDQIDWDIALQEERGTIHPVGLFDLDRNIRPAGRAYKKLIENWRQVLPTQSVCLQVPIVSPKSYLSGGGEKQKRSAAFQNESERTAPSNRA